MSSARDGAGGSRGAIAASWLGIVISSLLRARRERVIFRSSGSGVGAELLDSSIDRGMIPQSRRAGDTRVFLVYSDSYINSFPRGTPGPGLRSKANSTESYLATCKTLALMQSLRSGCPGGAQLEPNTCGKRGGVRQGGRRLPDTSSLGAKGQCNDFIHCTCLAASHSHTA